MTISIDTSLTTGLKNLVTRAFAHLMPARYSADLTFDTYEPVPVSREQISKMFHLDDAAPWSIENDMRASERRELDSMALIRGALYADN